MSALESLAATPRVRIRRPGPPDPNGSCVVYWMQRSQRALDNPALDTAVEAANSLNKPVVAYFAPVPFYPNANFRPYKFLAEGISDIATALAKRNIEFVLRRYADHSLLKFCDEVKPSLVVGDENPMREPEHWRASATKKLRVPFWTVDSDVVVPSRLIEKEQYAAFHLRKRLAVHLDRFLIKPKNLHARVAWRTPPKLQSLSADFDILEGWPINRSVSPVATFKGGTAEALRLLREFTHKKLAHYSKHRNHPELDGTARLSSYLHFGHIGPITIALAVQAADAPQAG